MALARRKFIDALHTKPFNAIARAEHVLLHGGTYRVFAEGSHPPIPERLHEKVAGVTMLAATVKIRHATTWSRYMAELADPVQDQSGNTGLHPCQHSGGNQSADLSAAFSADFAALETGVGGFLLAALVLE